MVIHFVPPQGLPNTKTMFYPLSCERSVVVFISMDIVALTGRREGRKIYAIDKLGITP